jgi:shikimate dehydrogenase
LKPDARTKLCAVVGHPIAHSLSPAIHNAALEHDARNAVYLAFDVVPEELESFVRGMRSAGAVGLNVTIPHKRAAAALCDVLDARAQEVGAVNTIVFTEGKAVGHNTDVAGVAQALNEIGEIPPDATALVIGAGGAGRAAAWALVPLVKEVWVANRTAARAEKLRSSIGRRARVVPWREVPGAAGTADVIVHATSVGLDADDAVLGPYELAKAKRCRALLDLVYGPDETPLVREARRVGIPSADGLMMLVHQAAAAYELFWNAPAPTDVMRSAALAVARPG